jgi:hypothetical protein
MMQQRRATPTTSCFFVAVRGRGLMDELRAPAARRGFLCGLAALPLIGGGVALWGRPVAAAAPVTLPLMQRYRDFLSRELLTAVAEIDMLQAPWRHFGPEAQERWRLAEVGSFVNRIPPVAFVCDEGPATRAVASAPPSTRAAVVLSAAGVPLP